MRNPLSQKVVQLEPSGIRKFFDIVNEMKDAISLGVGEPDFDTPWRIREEGIYSLERGRTFYTSNAGLKELKIEIANYLKDRVNVEYDPYHEVLVTVGADDRISGFRSLFFYSVKYGGVEMCHQIRHHHPDYFRRLASQAAGKGIRAVVEFLGKCFHTLLHVKSYLRAVAQRTANGGYADTKLLCQIFQ